MKTFKQKSLYAALAGVSALGATGAAQAVNVNPDGLGQVLIYPYYTARSIGPDVNAPYVSLLTVVNSTSSVKAVKVRFIEGKASQEVLDFNLFLSAKDVWTAAIAASPSVNGTGQGAGASTFDQSCTAPAFPTDGGNQPFVNFAYTGDPVADNSLDRTMEGYVEIIEMGVALPGTKTAIAATHVNGVPPGCPSLIPNSVDDISDPVNQQVIDDLTAPTGGLFGDMTLINVLAGTDYTEDAIALDNFINFATYEPPGDILPDLTLVNPPISIVVASSISGDLTDTNGFGSGAVVESGFFNLNAGEKPIDAISALFMHDHVYNDYVLDTQTASGTDWVLTFPTKRYYYDSTGARENLFQSNLSTNGACDDIGLVVYNREEQHAQGTAGFSPPAPGKTNQLCWESTVLTFNNSQVLGSTNNRNLTVTYQNGWTDLSFPFITGSSTHNLFAEDSFVIDLSGFESTAAVVYSGLPVVGFSVQSFFNGVLPEGNGTLVQSSYGGNFVHKFTRAITAEATTPDLAAMRAKFKHAKAHGNKGKKSK